MNDDVLLLGANGQLGSYLFDVLPALGRTLACASRDGRIAGVADGVTHALDLADPASIPARLDALAPAIIVNAAAYTAVDRAEDEEALATGINGDALGVIGAWARANNALVVHFSTDYVFDGRATAPYAVDAEPRPIGAYGRSKRAGEIALVASGAAHLIVRTAWVYSARGSNFLLTMLRLARERDALRVVDDQFGTPTPAAFLANAASALIEAWLDAPVAQRRALEGIYHATPSGHVSWHGFAETIIERAHALGLIERRVPVLGIASEDYPTRATRPAWSVLDISRMESVLGAAPDWQEGLEQALAELLEKTPQPSR